MKNCMHCGEQTSNPDPRVGVIHSHGKYVCYASDKIRVGSTDRSITVAEVRT